MRKGLLVFLCLLALAPCALGEGAPYLIDVYDEVNGVIQAVDSIMTDAPYTVLERMLPLPGTPWATALDAHGTIEWQRIAYDGDRTGWIVGNREVLLPKDGMDAVTGFVLCQSLTVRETPSTSAKAVAALGYGSWIVVSDWDGDWMRVSADNGQSGWVRGEYVLIDPPILTSEGETPVYAYPDADAPRVGLLSEGDKHPVIAQLSGYTVISLRGASGFIAN